MFSSGDIKNIVNNLHHENENAVGPMYIAQLSLEIFSKDYSNNISERNDAKILYIWIRNLESSIDDLGKLSLWASLFVLKCLKKYEYLLPHDSNSVLNFGEAVDSLESQIMK